MTLAIPQDYAKARARLPPAFVAVPVCQVAPASTAGKQTMHRSTAYGFVLKHPPQRPLSYFVNLNRAAFCVPSFKSSVSSKHLPANVLLVCQLKMNWFAALS